jgi:hypothetical protein
MTVAARLTAGEASWELDDVEWWLVEQHVATHGLRGPATVTLIVSGGILDHDGIGLLADIVRRLADSASSPLTFQDSPHHSEYDRRWLRLLQAHPVFFTKRSYNGDAAVFRGKVRMPGATAGTLGDLPPFVSLLGKLGEAVTQATITGSLVVWLARTYEGL